VLFRSAKANLLASKCREDAKKKAAEELGAIEKKAKKMLKYHQKAKSLKNEDLFAAVDTDKIDRVSEKEFLAFFASCEKEPKAEKKEDGDDKKDPTEDEEAPTDGELKRLFVKLDEEEEGSILKETFMNFIRTYMKVAKETVLTSESGIKDSKTLRRLEVGEAVEVLEGPVEEEEVKVMRINAKAMKDGMEGWVSLSGNTGAIFLEEGAHVFKVKAETILTEAFLLDGSGVSDVAKKKLSTRKLKVGELVECLVWPNKEESSGLMRMKCRCRSDGATGWVTTVGNQGTVYLEVA